MNEFERGFQAGASYSTEAAIEWLSKRTFQLPVFHEAIRALRGFRHLEEFEKKNTPDL